MRPLPLLFIFLLCGFGTGCDDPAEPKDTIGVSLLTTTNPFFKVIGDTITEEAEKHGYDTIVVSGDNDVAKQEAQLKDFIVRGVAAIVLCPCDSRSIGSAIREANEAGIPVFTADIACTDPNAKVVCHIATNNLLGGKQAAQATIEILPDGGEVAIVDFKEVESCQQRVKGFKEIIDKHNADNPAKMINVVAELPGEGDREKGYKAAQDALESNPGLDAIFAINDPSALGAYAALEKAGATERITIIGFDGQPEGKQAILEGKIYADPIQRPGLIGRRTVEMIMRYRKGEEVPPLAEIDPELYRLEDAKNDPSLKH